MTQKKKFYNPSSKNEYKPWMNIPEGWETLKWHYYFSLLKEVDSRVSLTLCFTHVCVCVCRFLWDRLGVLLHRCGRSYSHADLYLAGLLRWQETEAVPILEEIQAALALASALSREPTAQSSQGRMPQSGL